MDDNIHIELVTPEEADEWLNDMINILEGHDANVVGTILFMLEDLTEFITQNDLRKRQFMKFVAEQHGNKEAVH